MADNRLWLRHRPSGHTICLGKRLGWGWNAGNSLSPEGLTHLGGALQAFFDYCEAASASLAEQDDFELLIEQPAEGGALRQGFYRDGRAVPVEDTEQEAG